MWEQLKICFEEICDTARRRFPTISAGFARVEIPGVILDAYASFCYDPAQAEYEDLLLYFTWAEAGLNKSIPDVSPTSPGRIGSDVINFVIQRGTGKELAALEPATLPEDRHSVEYEQAVMDYARKTVAFVRENQDLILHALEEPW